MTLTIPDEIVPIIDFQFLGTISSAFAYGIVFILSGNCIYLLQTKRGIYSNRMRIFLLIYIIAMFLASTWALIRWTCEFMYWITILPRQLLNFPIELPLVIWGADGFMIWRCVILYQNVSKGPRIVIIVLLSLLSFASFVCGVTMLVEEPLNKPLRADQVFISLSTFVNIILAVLIVLRLVYYRRHVRNALGAEHGSPYTNIITMCVESSALMVIASGAFFCLQFFGRCTRGLAFWKPVLPHISVISPLLIIYRVALGRAIPPTLLPSEQAMAQIQFNIPLSNPSSQGEV